MSFLFKNNLKNKLNNKINYLLEASDIGLGRLTFEMWMSSQFGPNWIENVPNSNLYLYQQFFRHYPLGKPPSNWQLTTYTRDQINGQLDRVRIPRPTIFDIYGEPNLPPVEGPNPFVEKYFGLESAAQDYIDRILNDRPRITDDAPLTIPWPWEMNWYNTNNQDSNNSNNKVSE